MGLDAAVYCDCYEKSCLRCAPPQPELVVVDETGQRYLKGDSSSADWRAFDAWDAKACEHGSRGELVAHRLGNIARIGVLRELLSRTPEVYPVLIKQVLYDGSHCGDYIKLEDVSLLLAELDHLHRVEVTTPRDRLLLEEFERQMRELGNAAMRVRKPIVF